MLHIDSLIQQAKYQLDNNARKDRAKYGYAPIMNFILSLLSSPSFFFGALSGGLLSYFVIGPLIS